MERNEIIKALECCKSFRDFYMCDECPYSKALLADDESCTNRMSQDALSLIKELTEENERLNQSYTNLERKCASLNDECASLNDECASLNEENERLRAQKRKIEQIAEEMLSDGK